MKKKNLKFLIDENIPLSIALEIKKDFPESIIVLEEKLLRGKSDDEIYNFMIENSFILITFDLDFIDVLRFPIKNNIRIIGRFKNIKIDQIKKKILKALSQIEFDKLDDALIIISNNKIRIRKFSI